MGRKEIISCDICKKEDNKIECDIKSVEIQIIFTTDQTEGRSRKPYLSMEELDICEKCMNKILKGNYLFGSGAQGYNEYWFKEEEK